MELIYESNRIYSKDKDGNVVAEILFPAIDSNTVNITRTFVDESLRGQGVAGILMQAAMSLIRTQEKKVKLTCSYAKKWIDNHEQYMSMVVE